MLRSACFENCSKTFNVFAFTRLLPSLVKQFLESLCFSDTSSFSVLVFQQVIRHSMVGEAPRTVLSKHTMARF